MAAWGEVLRLRRGTTLFFVVLMTLLVTSFLAMVSQYQLFSVQVAQLTDQVELIVEVEALSRSMVSFVNATRVPSAVIAGLETVTTS